MGKRGPNSKTKKRDFFFDFQTLRKNLNSKQKLKLIQFSKTFRGMFLKVKEHLFQVNKMYDLMEQEYKKFQKDLFKDDKYISKPDNESDNDSENKNDDELILSEDVVNQILNNELENDNKEKKEEREIKKEEIDFDLFLNEDENKINEIKDILYEKNDAGKNFSEEFFDYKKYDKK